MLLSISIGSTKLLYILLAVIYFIVPWDLLPDFFGLVGRIDDLLLILFLIWRYKKLVSRMQQQHSDATAHSESEGIDEDGATSGAKAKKTVLDPYEALELQAGATKDEIDSQYRKLVSQYHPDKVHHLGEELQELAHEKMIQIQKAYEILS
ncbi:DnaJ domain-containing protein [Oligoflexia bacterium]|nr:DnaJ domain-containing protein [Oligoflexia bacterium]